MKTIIYNERFEENSYSTKADIDTNIREFILYSFINAYDIILCKINNVPLIDDITIFNRYPFQSTSPCAGDDSKTIQHFIKSL